MKENPFYSCIPPLSLKQYSTYAPSCLIQSASNKHALTQVLLIVIGLNQMSALKLNNIFIDAYNEQYVYMT